MNRHRYTQKLILCFFFLLYTLSVEAQIERDMQWLIGYERAYPNTEYGTLLDFSNDTLRLEKFAKLLPNTTGHSQICDSEGKILLYTDGCNLANVNNEYLINGLDITSDFLASEYCQTLGSPISQSIMILPIPNRPNRYCMFNYNLEILDLDTSIYTNSVVATPTKLYFHEIDMSETPGEVIEKKTIVLSDTLTFGNMQAVRHANGEDWWLVLPEGLSNCYYFILVDENGFHTPFKQCIGQKWSERDWTGMVTFSPNGKTYARFDPYHGLNIFDFDRCKGELSNPLHIPIDSAYVGGLAFSASSRFLYVTTSWEVYQFDMQAEDIAASKTLVAEYDGFVAFATTNFYQAKLAPDNKIYMAGTSSSRYLHVINYPDRKGVACDVAQHSLKIPSNHAVGLPNTPHYRLGKAEEFCEEIVNTKEIRKQTSIFELFPNPASQSFQIKTNNTLKKQIVIRDVSGKVVYEIESNDTSVQISLDQVGVFYCSLFYEDGRVKTQKIVFLPK
ncbi:MAG: T9SS type A sorting domain-containing protein [Bacteroidota bacterium]